MLANGEHEECNPTEGLIQESVKQPEERTSRATFAPEREIHVRSEAALPSVANQRSTAPHAHSPIAGQRSHPFSHPFDPFHSYFQNC
jgi:hypothetical protein